MNFFSSKFNMGKTPQSPFLERRNKNGDYKFVESRQKIRSCN